MGCMLPIATLNQGANIWQNLAMTRTLTSNKYPCLASYMQVVGRNWNGLPDNPCRVKRIPSPIPTRRWYLRPWVIALMGGLLPFGSIFIEMYFVFTSFWNYKASPHEILSFRSNAAQSLTFAPGSENLCVSTSNAHSSHKLTQKNVSSGRHL